MDVRISTDRPQVQSRARMAAMLRSDAAAKGVTLNGAAEHPPSPSISNGMDQAVIHVNFGVSGRQVLAVLASIPATIAALGTAGLLFMPAKEKDLAATRDQMVATSAQLEVTKQQLTQSIQNQEAIRTTVLELTGAVRELQEVVSQVRDAPPKVIVREVRTPQRQTAKPPAPVRQ